MSVIAWDGRILAADRRLCIGGLPRQTSKLFWTKPEYLLAYAGSAEIGVALVDWYESGAEVCEFPVTLADTDNDENRAELLIVHQNGTIETYSRSPYPVRIKDSQYATGSGRDFAMAAMHLGKNAIEAVEIACLFDIYCGDGVDSVQFV